jgi:septation ring formation regulator EzrA
VHFGKTVEFKKLRRVRVRPLRRRQDMETRLDRIEKALETLLVGTAELKESQKKTDEQMRRTDARLDRVGKQLADLGLVRGEVAEELFYRNLRSVFSKRKVITQTDEGGATLLNRDDFEPKALS